MELDLSVITNIDAINHIMILGDVNDDEPNEVGLDQKSTRAQCALRIHLRSPVRKKK